MRVLHRGRPDRCCRHLEAILAAPVGRESPALDRTQWRSGTALWAGTYSTTRVVGELSAGHYTFAYVRLQEEELRGMNFFGKGE